MNTYMIYAFIQYFYLYKQITDFVHNTSLSEV